MQTMMRRRINHIVCYVFAMFLYVLALRRSSVFGVWVAPGGFEAIPHTF